MGNVPSILDHEIVQKMGPINMGEICFGGQAIGSTDVGKFQSLVKDIFVYVEKDEMYVLLMLTTLLSNSSKADVKLLHRLCQAMLVKKLWELPQFRNVNSATVEAKFHQDFIKFKTLMYKSLSVVKFDV